MLGKATSSPIWTEPSRRRSEVIDIMNVKAPAGELIIFLCHIQVKIVLFSRSTHYVNLKAPARYVEFLHDESVVLNV